MFTNSSFLFHNVAHCDGAGDAVLNPNGALDTVRSNQYLLTGQRGANYYHRGAIANSKARMLHMRKLKPKPTQFRRGKKQS